LGCASKVTATAGLPPPRDVQFGQVFGAEVASVERRQVTSALRPSSRRRLHGQSVTMPSKGASSVRGQQVAGSAARFRCFTRLSADGDVFSRRAGTR
jgi:hypothetical protein